MFFHKKRTIGYALGGGVARGLFHIGVLNVLEENHIYPDVIVGTSMGAVVGALYASGMSAKEIKQMAIDLDWRRMARLADLTLTNKGLIHGKRISSFIESILKVKNFSQLQIKFACVATDITSGDQVVLQNGSLIEAVRASFSLPAIFTPVKIKGRYLVDGGLVNVVPVSVCRELGAEFVIGVNVIPVPNEDLSIMEAAEKYYKLQTDSSRELSSPLKRPDSHRSRAQDIEQSVRNFFLSRLSRQKRQMIDKIDLAAQDRSIFLPKKEPTLSTVVSQTLSIVEYRLAIENIKEADIAITPFSGNIGFWQFNRASEAITAGEIAARLTLQRSEQAQRLLKHYQSKVS